MGRKGSCADRSRSRRGGCLLTAALAYGCVCWCCGSPAKADPVAPPAQPPTTASSADAAPPVAGFQSQDISIGEPISLPFAAPLPAAPQPPSAPAFPRTAAAPADSSGTGAAEAAGTGWLGLAVDDALVTGRLVVVEVAPDGPAARAGVRPQDVLLAINGSPLKDSDELAAALAAISPGQRVRMALGRDSRVDEVEAVASTRPPRAIARENGRSADAAAMTAVPQAEPRTVAVPPTMSRAETTLAPMMAAPSQFQAAAPAMPTLPPAPVSSQPQTFVAAPAFAAAPPIAAPPSVTFPTPAAAPASAAASAAAPTSAAASAAALAPPPARPAPPAALQSTPGRTALGVRTVPVDAATRARFQLDQQQGAMVIGVVHDLPAARAGVPPGSVIVAINHQPVRSPQDLTQLVTQGPVGRPVPLQYVLPGGESRNADVVLQSLDRPLEQALVGSESRPVAAGGEPPSLAPAANTSRRVQPTVANRASEPEPLVRFEELLRRLNDRLDRLEQRFERLSGGR
jgi:S1-C subfamily serine protease